MSVRIRLRHTGKRNAGAHRIVVADKRKPRNGRFIETIGVYDPRHNHETIDLERADYWLGNGAQPSETVAAIIKRAKAGMTLAQKKGGVDRIEAGKRKAQERAEAEARAAAQATEEKPAEQAEKTETAEGQAGTDETGTEKPPTAEAEESPGETTQTAAAPAGTEEEKPPAEPASESADETEETKK